MNGFQGRTANWQSERDCMRRGEGSADQNRPDSSNRKDTTSTEQECYGSRTPKDTSSIKAVPDVLRQAADNAMSRRALARAGVVHPPPDQQQKVKQMLSE